MALLILPSESACVVEAKANVQFVGWQKIEFKKSAVEKKIKNTEGSAMSVGLLVVCLQYGLYVLVTDQSL